MSGLTLDYYLPKSIPPEILAYGEKLAQLGVGKAGKLGALMLRLEADSKGAKTTVKEQFSQVPLYTQRALYLEESLPNMAYMYIISPSGGILQGDRYRMDIALKNNAFAHITSQGATRVYRMDKNYATQVVNISVGDGCYFEYMPDQIIPYRDSRFYQQVSIDVHDNATMLYSEMVVPGRVASGEHFEYDICYMKTLAKNQDGKLRFVDIAILQPKKSKISSFGLLDGHDVVGNMYVMTKKEHVATLNEEIYGELKKFENVLSNTSIMPYDSGIVIRMLGNTASNLRDAMFEVIRVVRKNVLGASFGGIRKP